MLTRRYLLNALALFIGVALSSSLTAQEGEMTETVADDRPSFTADDTVVVLGGSGRVGRLIVQQLVEAGVEVRAVTRNIEKAQAEINPDYPWVSADVTQAETLSPVLEGATHVIFAASYGKNPESVDYQGVVNAVDASKKAGVDHFLLISSAGVTHETHILNKLFNDILKWKAKGEAHLRQSGLDYTIVRPYGLRDGLKGQSAETGILFLQGDDAQNGIISRGDVARVCIEALVNPESSGKTFEITNFYAAEPGVWRKQFSALAADE